MPRRTTVTFEVKKERLWHLACCNLGVFLKNIQNISVGVCFKVKHALRKHFRKC